MSSVNTGLPSALNKLSIITSGSNTATAVSTGRAISGDGTTVVALGSSGPWVSTNLAAPQLISTVLTNMGVNLQGFVLGDVYDVSNNGHVMVGIGHAVLGQDEGWIVVLP